MSNISKVFATYNGEEFECKIGEEYEFSDDEKFKWIKTLQLLKIESSSVLPFLAGTSRYKFIRPVQKTPLTCEELYRICGKKGYEVMCKHGDYGVLTIAIRDNKREPITHYRKAYSTEEWKPISQIERER